MPVSWPPATPTPEEEQAYSTLDRELKTLLASSKVPYFIWGKLATAGYTSIQDFADRWDDKKDVKANAPTDMDFGEGANGFDKESSMLASIRLGHALSEAQERVKVRSRALAGHASAPMSARAIVEAVDRRNMEQSYKANSNNGRVPPLENQVSDTGLGSQFKYVQNGQLGYMSIKQLVPFLPDPSLHVIRETMKNSNGDGTSTETVEEALLEPTTWEAVRKVWVLFRTNLSMCLDSNPQHTHLQLTHNELDDFYTFLEGPEIAKKSPAPSAKTLLEAERAAWRKIATKVHSDLSASQALKEVRADSLFWQREIYDKCRIENPKGWKGYKGSGKTYMRPEPYTTHKGGKKGKYKGKSASPDLRDPGQVSIIDRSFADGSWSKYAPDWREYCIKYQKGTCQAGSQCSRSHNCPKLLATGWICNRNDHRAVDCPHL